MIKLSKLSSLFSIALIAFIIPTLNNQEVCESYSYNGYLHEEQNCSIYCCGSCTIKYCCGYPSLRLNQSSCSTERPKQTKTPNPDNSILLLYWITYGLFLAVTLCLSVLLIFKSNVSKRLKQTASSEE